MPDRDSLTIGDVARAFLADYEELVIGGKRARVTLRGYEIHVRLHLLPFAITRVKVSRLSGPDCVAYARALERQRSDTLARRVFTTFRMMLDYAWGQGWIGANPARAVTVRTAPAWEADQERLDIPPLADLRAILEATRTFDDTGRAEAFVSVLLFQALRISKLRALGKEHVDLRGETPELRVRRKANRWNRLERVKTRTSLRDIPLVVRFRQSPPLAARTLTTVGIVRTTSNSTILVELFEFDI